MTFYHVKPGDKVKRLLAGVVPMTLTVAEVTEKLIVTKGGWTFDRETGIEEDEDLGWGRAAGVTGSYLVDAA